MTTSVLITYATRYGSTQEVAEAIATTLREHGLEVNLQSLREVRSLKDYHAVVLGAPLFMFHWHKDAKRFLSRHRNELKNRSTAVFALGPIKDPYDEAEWKDARTQLDKELANFPWFTPISLEIFGGKLDPEKVGFPFGAFAKSVPASDIRDWEAIRKWANDLATQFELKES